MPSRYRGGGLGKANLFDTNIKATQIDEDIFTDQEVLTSIADNDLILLLDVSEDPDEIKYMTKSNLISGLPTLTGSTDNTLVTVTGASAISGEANLLFDGTILTNDGGEINIDISSGDPHLSFQIGGTDEFTIGVDDTDSDIFKIDTGGAVGGATKLSIDTSGNVIIAGGITTGSTSFVNSSGVIQVASQTNITGVGTIGTGTWQGTAVADTYVANDLTISGGTVNNSVIGGSATAAITGTTIDATTDFTIGTLVVTDDQIQMTPTTSDTVTIQGSTNGVLNITTVDNDATAANLNFVIDGAVDVDSAGTINLDAGTGIWTFEDSGTEMLRITEGNSGDVTVKLVTNAKDLIFSDNGDAVNMKILDAAAGINVPGEVQTAKIAFTDGDDSMTIADGGKVTFSAGFAVGSDAEGDVLYSDGTNYIRLAKGSDADVLTLASGVPSWATPTVGDITSVAAGVGLSGGGTTGALTLTLDLSELSTVTPADGDFFSTLDSDGANEQKTTTTALATLFAGTGLTASSSIIGVDTSQAITTLTGGDLTLYEDANNADVSLKMGTSATESLSIEVLNGGSNKTAEEVRITTATASGTANHGKISIYIDGAEILDIDDGGIDMASGMTVALNGTDIASASGAITAITSLLATDIVIGEDAQTKIDFGTANEIDFMVDNAVRLTLTSGALYPVTNNQIDLGTSSLEFKDAFFDGTVTADAFAGALTGNVTGNASGTAATVTGGTQASITSTANLVTVGTIGTGVWQGTAIASAYIAGDAITGAKIADDAIDSEHYTNASIDNAHLADNAVDTEEIADNAITLAKMAGGTDGNIISYDASGDPVAIATGTDGQVLTSTGAGSPPAFEDVAAGGVSVTAGHSFKAGAPLVLSKTSLNAEASNVDPMYSVEHQTTDYSNGCQALGKTLSDGKRIGLLMYGVGATTKVRPITIDPYINAAAASMVSFGTETEIDNTNTGANQSISYDVTANRFLCAFAEGDSGDGDYRKAVTMVVQVDDDMSVTLGSRQTISTNTIYNGYVGTPTVAYIGGTINRHVIMYSNNSGDSTSYLFYRVLTLTGSGTNSVAAGDEATVSGNEMARYMTISPDTVTSSGNSGKFMLAFYAIEDGSNRYKAVIGTVTGASTNTIAFGSEVNFYTGTQVPPGHDGFPLAFNTDRSMWAIMFDKGVATAGDTSAGERNTVWIVSLEVSGTTITVDTANEAKIDDGNSAGSSIRMMFLMYHKGQQCYYAGGFDSTNSYNFTGGAVQQAADGSFTLSSFSSSSSQIGDGDPGASQRNDAAYLYDEGSGTMVFSYMGSGSDGYMIVRNMTQFGASNSTSARGNGIIKTSRFVGIAKTDSDYGDAVELFTYGSLATGINAIYNITAANVGNYHYLAHNGIYSTSDATNAYFGMALSTSSIMLIGPVDE